MISVAGTLGVMLIVIMAGKRVRATKPVHYFFIVLAALAQVCFVMYEMYVMGKPSL